MSTSIGSGRLGNQIIRNLAASIFAEKHNLLMEYQNYELIQKLGLKLFVGDKKYNITKQLTDNNYFNYHENQDIDFNVETNGYFQTKKITDNIHLYLLSDEIMNNIITVSEI
jgi:hypothetical protein